MDYNEDTYLDYSPEFESFEFEESQGAGEVFSEAELMELAEELLQVGTEAELDQFLGKLIKRVGRGIRRAVRSPVFRAIGGYLKGVAKKALPIAGAALGGAFGGPLGAKIGRGLARAAGGALGLEAETLNGEDLEFEGAKHFSRLAAEAIKSALDAPGNVNPATAAQQAVSAATAKFAPGLLIGTQPPALPRSAGNSGRWERQGRDLILRNFF